MENLNSIFDQVFDLNLLIYKAMLTASHIPKHGKIFFPSFFNINLLELLPALFHSFQDHALLCLTATLYSL